MQVPNQPVIFEDELPHPPFLYPKRERNEDGIVAYGWRKFLDARQANTTVDARWLLRLPMTKAVSVAMDAIVNFSAREDSGAAGVGFGSLSVHDFVVAGKSKRGWTTWTTGLVEPVRCRAIVPVVEDLLKLRLNSNHDYQALGGWTFSFADYVYAGVVGAVLNTPAFAELAEIVDPYAYLTTARWQRQRGDAPWLGDGMVKLVVNAGNDEFFLPADNHLWWGALPGEKHLLHLPNADHGFHFYPTDTAPAVYDAALLAFYRAVVTGSPRETFTWRLLRDSTGASVIEVGNASSAPARVSVWSATTTDGQRDWRFFNCRTGPSANCTYPEDSPADPSPRPGGPQLHPVPYTEVVLAEVNQVWRAVVPAPTDGNFTAALVSVRFASGEHYTSQMVVAPDRFPFAECSEAGLPGGCGRLV